LWNNLLYFLFVGKSSQISGKKVFFNPKKFRYEDLTSITEDKDLSFLDFFIKEAIRANLSAAIDFVKLQQEQISKLKLELINAKVAFTNAKFCHLNSQQPSSASQAPPTPGLTFRTPYAQATKAPW
jgi:hypothetical protein